MRGCAPDAGVEQEARALVERLGGTWTMQGGLCRCPAHDDRTPSLSVRAGRTRLLLHCFAGCTASDVLRALASAGQLDAAGAYEPSDAVRVSPGSSRATALRLWEAGWPISGTPAERYLAVRGLVSDSAELRFHPRTPDGPQPLTRFRPSLIAAVRDDRAIVAVHRTFLEPGGARLAALDHPRRGLGRFGHGAIRLGGTGPRLGLAEGIETALSARLLFGVPCWATLGTERFRLVTLPPEVRELLLFLDHDSGGRRAERLAREAFAHVECIEVHVPERPGEDWNDVLRTSAALRTA